jgi:hypothetical protein
MAGGMTLLLTLDDVLFAGRLFFLVLAGLFVLGLAWAAWHDARSAPYPPDDSAPGELVVVEPGTTGLDRDDTCPPAPLLGRTLIGSSAGNDVVLPDRTVSTVHAILRWNGGTWSIQNRSDKGTYVNQRLVTRSSTVRFGSIIQLGSVALRLLRPQE